MGFFTILAMNLGLAVAVCLAIWVTKSPWPLLGFMFLSGWKAHKKYGTCPECKKTVVLVDLEKDSG